MLIRSLFLLLFSLAPAIFPAVSDENSAITVTPEFRKGSLALRMFQWRDATGKLTLEDVRSGRSSGWRRDAHENFGLTRDVFWIRFDLVSETERDLVLEIAYPHLDDIRFYRPEKGGYVESRMGDDFPFSHRRFDYRYPNLLLKTAAGRSTYFLRVASTSSMNFPLTLYDRDEFLEKNSRESLILGLYYGILAVMALYNLFLYFSLLDRSYFYYAFFIGLYGLFQFMWNGLAFQVFWPEQVWWENKSAPVLISMSNFAALLFSRKYLLVRETAPRLYRFFSAQMIIAAAVAILSFFSSYQIIIRIALLISLFSITLMLGTGMFVLARGFKPARYFLFAWFGFLLGAFLFALMGLGVLPDIFLTRYGSQVGSLTEVILLSLGLAYRISLLRQEKDDANLRMVQTLKNADRLKDEFLANTSHELRTPLHGIIGLTESMLAGGVGPLTVPMRSNLEMITYSGKRLASLVNDLLDFSRLKHHELSLKLQALDLHSLSDAVIKLSQPLLAEKPVQLVNRINGRLKPVLGDENRVTQILLNLTGNAIKFTEKGEITLDAEEDGEFITVRVSDTGIGIPGDRLTDIFIPFEQVQGSAERNFGGTGIGLSITRQLVELHGGTIGVSSREGEGSVFQFTLPRADRPAEPLSFHPTESPGVAALVQETEEVSPVQDPLFATEMSGMRVLLVDDEPVNRQVIRNILSPVGLQVSEASNGRQSLEDLQRDLPDLVLLDVMMPQMNGYTVCTEIRRSHAPNRLPVIMLTARGQLADLVQGLNVGANDYISKPFSRAELLARIRTQLSLLKMQRAYEGFLGLQKELEVAARIQKSVLPATLPENPGWSLHADLIPMVAVGGDYFNVHEKADGSLGMFVADVSGHGVPAALIVSMLNILFSMMREAVSEPGYLLTEMNTRLYGQCDRHFVTASAAFYDRSGGRLIIASAGHPPVLIYNHASGSHSFHKARGTVIGAFAEKEFTTITVPVHPGDRVILYTDGIIEAGFSAGQMLEEAGFLRLVSETGGMTTREAASAICSRVLSHSAGTVDDDITLMVLDIA